MPSSLIEVRREYSQADEIALIDAVHDALVVAFKIPVDDKHLRLVVHAPHRFVTSPGLERPECYTQVTIDCLAGRSLTAKRSLYRELVTRLGRFEIPADHVTVMLRDIPLENWGIRGGQAACDVELGYDLDV